MTEAGKSYQHYKWILSRSLLALSGNELFSKAFNLSLLNVLKSYWSGKQRSTACSFAVGAAVTVVGIAAYRAYLVHRHAQS